MAAHDASVSTLFSDGVEAITDRPAVVGYVLLGAILGLVPVVGGFLATACNGLAAGAAVRGLGAPIEGNRSTVRRLVSLVGGSIAGALAVLLGLLLLVLPGIYVALRLILLPAETVAGNERALDALSASWQRTEGNVLTVLGFQVAVFVVGTVVGVPLFTVFGGWDAPLAVLQSPGFRIALTLVGVPINALSLAGIGAMYVRFDR